MQTLEPILAEHPFFKGLDARYVKLLAGCAKNVRVDPGAYLTREGDKADQFYIIRQGKIAVETFVPQKGAVTIETIAEGEVLGWSWLFPPYTSHFSARAVELTRAIALDAACLRKKSEEDHELGYDFLKRFSRLMLQRLQATRLRILDIYGVSPKG